jgi:hypothetical protein
MLRFSNLRCTCQCLNSYSLHVFQAYCNMSYTRGTEAFTVVSLCCLCQTHRSAMAEVKDLLGVQGRSDSFPRYSVVLLCSFSRLV